MVYEFSGLSINHDLGDLRIKAWLPADVVREKLAEVGYEIRGVQDGKWPAIIRGNPPAVTFVIIPSVKITMSVTRMQSLLRRSPGYFDVYELTKASEPKKSEWQ